LLRKVVEDALRAARDELLDVLRRGSAAEALGRGFYGDISYRGDVVCENAIVEVLRSRLDNATIVSEEGGIMSGSAGRLWALVDPVDGSANMARGINFYSSGLAIAMGPSVRDVVCSGVIDHVSGELFVREGDYVSHPPSKMLEKEGEQDLDGARVFFHHASLKRGPPLRDSIIKITERLSFFRVMGSALLEMCLAGAGRSDGYLCLTTELRLMDIVPALYFALGAGCKAATSPSPILDDRLDSRTRYGIILTKHQKIFEQTLSILNTRWSRLE